ncbi:MAG: hypothetical protein CMJ32_11735 [Phycisphaerae bacterium]|nr:hypothetical protein [Phycisphaerae bacterium]
MTDAPRAEGPRLISTFTLAMMCAAIVVGIEGLPDMASYGLAGITIYAFFGLFYFIPVGLVSAELGAGWPRDGGVYNWVKLALGSPVAMVALWCQWTQIVVWYPTVLAVAAEAILYLFNPDLATNPKIALPLIIGTFWFATLINLPGLRISGIIITSCFWIGTLLPVVLLVVMAVWWLMDGQEPMTSMEPRALLPRIDSIGALVLAMLAFSFLSGLEANSVHFRRVRNPSRAIPMALFIAVIIVLLMSTAGSISISIFVKPSELEMAAGPLQVFRIFTDHYGMHWLLPALAIAVFLGMFGHMVVWIIGPTESLRVASDDGLVPPLFRRVNKRGVPSALLIMQAILVTVLCLPFAFLDMNMAFVIITAVSAQIYLVMYALMFITAIVLRYKYPDAKRPYRIPCGKAGIWLVAGIGFIITTGGIFLLCIPPDSEALSIPAATYMWLVIPATLVMLLVPILIYKFKPDSWTPIPDQLPIEEPGGDEQ